MGKIVKKYIGSAQVGAVQIRLENDDFLVGRNAADSADVDILKVDALDAIQMASFFLTPAAAPTADYEVSNKKYVDDEIAGIDLIGKANTNLNNLVNTAIPTAVSLNSDSIVQTNDATQFEVRTIDQTTAVSGSVRIRSGSVAAGAFSSGAARMVSGNSADPVVGGTNATGLVTIAVGTISANAGLTTGNTGGLNLLGGDITGAGSHTGNTGIVTLRSGNITNASNTGTSGLLFLTSGSSAGAGNSGDAVLLTGNTSGSGASGVVAVRSGEASSSGVSGNAVLSSGRSASGLSGTVTIVSGAISATAGNYPGQITNNTNGSRTGNIFIASGLIDNASNTVASGDVSISSGSHAGSGASGQLNLSTGNNSGSGNSGDIIISTGTVVSGSRGVINMAAESINIVGSFDVDASANGTIQLQAQANINIVNTGVGEVITINPSSHVDMSAKQIKNMADPTDPQDAATRAFVLAQVAAGIDFANERIALDSTDISAQSITLAEKYMPDSITVSSSRVVLNVIGAAGEDPGEEYDFVVNNAGLTTVLEFRGPSATAGAEALVDGDILFIKGVLLA